MSLDANSRASIDEFSTHCTVCLPDLQDEYKVVPDINRWPYVCCYRPKPTWLTGHLL